jgi:diguanylate cyclase (GGDEF)-like protein
MNDRSLRGARSASPEPQGPPLKSWRASLVRAAVLAAAWILLWRISALMEYAPHASIWFPPAALTLASLLVLGWRALPLLVVCAVTVTFWTNAIYALDWGPTRTLVTGLCFAAAHVGAFALGAVVLRWLGALEPRLSLPALVIAFLLVASSAALLAALAGVEAMILAGAIERSDAAGLWLPWWIGDMAAAVALTPLFAGVLADRREKSKRRFPVIELPLSSDARGAWALKLALLLGLLVMIMTLTRLTGEGELMAFTVFFLILPQMWITYTEPALRVALSLAAFSTLAAFGVGLLGLKEYAMVYQFAITVIAATTWFGLSVPTLVEQNRRLRELAEADALTGVTGRRHFFERARDEVAIAQRRGVPQALIVFDIDRFKDINDRYGHSRGDKALIEVSEVVRRHLRKSDLFGRFGGDEFMLLMVGCTRRQAVERAEQIRTALHEVRSTEHDASISGTFSVVELGEDEGLAQAFDRADVALLAAKREGRDRVTVARAVSGRAASG